MTKSYIKPLILMTLCIIGLPRLYAQFSVDAHYRPRFEIRDGYQKLAAEHANPSVFISQRTRLSFSFETDRLKIRFTPQDVRTWGDEQTASSTGVMGDPASVEMFEGYAEIKVADAVWISAGRQQLRYHNDRILGNRNWNQTGISYDAMIVKYNRENYTVHLGASWNSLSETLAENYYPSSRIKSLNFLWINRQLSDKSKVSFLHIASGVTPSDTSNTIHFRQTSGLYSEFKEGNWSAWGGINYQYGKNKSGKKVSAFLLDAEAGYKHGKMRPGLGVSYLSGNRKTGSAMSTDHLFDVLYGNRHKFFGGIDYFRDFPKNTAEGGLVDIYGYIDFQISKKMNIRNTAHYFSLVQTNEKTLEEPALGFENDLILLYNFAPWGQLESGYCFFLPTKTLKEIQSVDKDKFSGFFYLMVTLTPNLFKQ